MKDYFIPISHSQPSVTKFPEGNCTLHTSLWISPRIHCKTLSTSLQLLRGKVTLRGTYRMLVPSGHLHCTSKHPRHGENILQGTSREARTPAVQAN